MAVSLYHMKCVRWDVDGIAYGVSGTVDNLFIYQGQCTLINISDRRMITKPGSDVVGNDDLREPGSA